MTNVAISKNGPPLEASVPGASLESILCTEELARRSGRPPDYQTENRARGTGQRASGAAVQYSSDIGRDDPGRHAMRLIWPKSAHEG